MDDLERIHQKDELKKWIRSLSHEDWQEYKRKHRSRKEVQYRIEKIIKRVYKAIEDKNKVSVKGERKFLQRAYFTYLEKAKAICDWLPSRQEYLYSVVYHLRVIDLFHDCDDKIEEFLNQPPSFPSSPTILHTMTAISRCENSLSPETKTMLQEKKLERRSIRGRITKAINKLKKDIDAKDSFAVAITKASLLKTLEESEKKDDEIWVVYDDDALAEDMSEGVDGMFTPSWALGGCTWTDLVIFMFL